MRGRTSKMAVVIGATLLVPAASPVVPGGSGRSEAVSVVAPAHPTAIGRPTLSLGAQGEAVRALQARLRALGARAAVDGRFGPETRRGVLALQASRGLLPDGVVGPLTWQVLDGGGPILSSYQQAPPGRRPILRLGSSGSPVVEMQTLLRRAGLRNGGLRAGSDGRFGPETLEAVVAFQRTRGLVVDGVVGPATWAALSTALVLTPISLVVDPWRTIGARSYVVRRGDTLVSIAEATGSTPAALAAANRVPLGSRPPAGSSLLVPGRWRCVVPGGGFINDYGFARAGGRTHQGNDLFAERGTPVLAPVGGLVEQRDGGLGGVAANLHGNDGHRYYFAHLDRHGTAGRVAAGTVIGYVGNSGNAVTTPPHLHFEIHPGGGGPVNPFPTLILACRR